MATDILGNEPECWWAKDYVKYKEIFYNFQRIQYFEFKTLIF